MSYAIKSTFQDMSEAEFGTYATGLVDSYSTGSERKHATAYLQQVNSADSVSLQQEAAAARKKLLEHRKKQRSIEAILASHQFDFSKTPTLFQTQTPLTESELDTLLTQDNSEIFVRNLVFVKNIIISGNGVLLDGQGSVGSARQDTLTNLNSITGTIHIEGDNTVIRGIDFNSADQEKALTFGVGAENVTFINCKFTAGTHADSKWFYGGNLGGSVTITNCRVEGFKSWYLADFSSTSGEPQAALTKVRMKRCYFLNNWGSIACRGKTGTPTKLVSYTQNKFETDTLHASFWDFLEANGALKVVVENNEAIAPVGTELEVGKKGFLQTFSKNAKPWVLKYKNNKISNLKIGGKIALNNGFYSPNTSNYSEHYIDLSAELENVTYAFSFLYKNNDGTTASADKWQPQGLGSYSPLNVGAFPSPPSVVNPSGYAIVSL